MAVLAWRAFFVSSFGAIQVNTDRRVERWPLHPAMGWRQRFMSAAAPNQLGHGHLGKCPCADRCHWIYPFNFRGLCILSRAEFNQLTGVQLENLRCEPNSQLSYIRRIRLNEGKENRSWTTMDVDAFRFRTLIQQVKGSLHVSRFLSASMVVFLRFNCRF